MGDDVPLLLVGTARPELLDRRPNWGGGKRNATTLSLSPLPDEEIRDLVEALLRDSDVSTGTPAGLLARAGGNPLYAEQFARMLLERRQSDHLPLPETIHGIIAARLDGLAPGEKRLLQDASVLGKVFWVEPLVMLGGVDAASLDEHLHALARKEFVRRTRHTSVADEVEYAFAHALVRDVAYGQVPRRARVEKHRAVAEWLEGLSADRVQDRAEMLAHHYVSALELALAAGEDVGGIREKCRLWLMQAGDRAYSLNALPAAARFYEAALSHCPPGDPERPDLLLRYGRSRPDDAEVDEGLLEEASVALAARGDRSGAAEAEVLLAFVWWVRGFRDRFAEHLEHGRSLVQEEPPSPEKTHVLSDLARFRMLAGQHRAAIEVGREAMDMARSLGLKVMEARILCTIGTSRATLGDEEGVADLEHSADLGKELQSLTVRWNALINLATVLSEWGELDRVSPIFDDPAIREPASESDRRWTALERASLAYQTGDWEEAQWQIQAFETAGVPGQPHYMEFMALDLKARFSLARGALDYALDSTDRELELTRAITDPQALLVALGTRAKCLRAAGRIEEVEPLVEEVLAAWRAADALNGMTAALDVAWALRELGREREMLEVLDARPWRPKWFDAAERVLRGDLSGAADICREIGSLPEEADARMLAAEDLPPDDPERAEHLRRALDFYRRVGASELVGRCEAMLNASPLKPARPDGGG